MRKNLLSGGGRETPLVVVALPLAYREGVDEYNGLMRYMCETGAKWDLRIVRHSFGKELFREFPIEDVDGVICGMDFIPGIVSYEPYFPEDLLDFLSGHGVPTVALDVADAKRYLKRSAPRSFLSIDSETIGRKAAQFLAKAGEYASFGFVGAFADRAWSRDRGAFFVRELRRLGRREVSIFQGEAARRGDDLLAWLKTMLKPAAIFASNDYCADGVLKVCAQGGLRVPDDLVVLGVDDDPIFCIHTDPSLSSLHPDFEAEGYVAAQTMAEFLAGRRPLQEIVVGGEMAVAERMSTAPCSPAGRLVRKADEIIARRASMGLTSDVLAGMLGISRRLLDLRYRQINGCSVRTAIELKRLDEVRKLLLGTHLPLKAVARACGYGSESYLSHVFQRTFGLSMSEFRLQAANRRPDAAGMRPIGSDYG